MIPDAMIVRLNALERRVEHLETGEALPIVARYTTQTGSLASGVLTRIDYATQVYDPWAAVTTGASWVFTAKVGGYYLVRAAVVFDSSTAYNTGEILYLALYKNAGAYSYIDYINHINAGGVGLYVQLAGADIVQLNKDETCHVRAYQAIGATLSLVAAAGFNFVSVSRLG